MQYFHCTYIRSQNSKTDYKKNLQKTYNIYKYLMYFSFMKPRFYYLLLNPFVCIIYFFFYQFQYVKPLRRINSCVIQLQNQIPKGKCRFFEYQIITYGRVRCIRAPIFFFASLSMINSRKQYSDNTVCTNS